MDLYKILGVKKNASIEEIKRAYREIAKEAHPDKGGDEKVFKEAASAYEILSDKQKRKLYDETGEVGKKDEEVVARETAVGLFLQVVNGTTGRNLNHVNVFECVRDQVRNILGQIDRNVTDKKREIERLNNVLFRIKKRDSFFRSVCKGHVSQIKEDIKRIKKEKDLFKRVLEILKDEEYIVDPSNTGTVEVRWPTSITTSATM